MTVNNEEKVIFCKCVDPLYISFAECKDNPNIECYATVTYLCRDKEDNIFVMNRVYACKDEEERLGFEVLPYAEYETDFITRRIESRWINSYLPRFVTNFQFYLPNDFNKELHPTVYTYGIKPKESGKYKIEMDLETYVSLVFLDSYPISDDDDNDHDLAIACINAAKEHDKKAEMFLVDDLDIINITNGDINYYEPEGIIEKIKSIFSRTPEIINTNLILQLKLEKFISKDEKDIVSLLASFDFGVALSPDKFKGKTPKDIENSYLSDADQYTTSLMVTNTKIHGIDKDYMVIRAINKDQNVKIFLLDKDNVEKIYNKINNF